MVSYMMFKTSGMSLKWSLKMMSVMSLMMCVLSYHVHGVSDNDQNIRDVIICGVLDDAYGFLDDVCGFLDDLYEVLDEILVCSVRSIMPWRALMVS